MGYIHRDGQEKKRIIGDVSHFGSANAFKIIERARRFLANLVGF